MNEERKIEIEEVDGVAAPPRARVTPEFERKRDYLAGFLTEKKPEPDPATSNETLVEAVVEALKSIYDPEIPVDIYELGLIYDVAVSADGDLSVEPSGPTTTAGQPIAVTASVSSPSSAA